MEERKEELELLSCLRGFLEQVLVIVERNRPDDPFFGTDFLVGEIEGRCEAADISCPIRFEHRHSRMPFTRIYLGYPYDDAARMFRIDDGTVKLLGRERYRAHLKEAQEFAVSVLKVWLGLIPIWERLSRESHPPLPCAGQAGDHRPAFLRDHLWLKWHEDEGMGAAKIRDRWDAITDDERRGISPKIWEKVGGHDRACQKAGYEVVKRALKVAKQERNRRA